MFRRRLIWNGTPKAPIVDGVPLVANVGDIAYKATNGKIMVVAPDLWDTSLGTPVGVVVIPSGFAPDNGLARIVSLKWVNSSGVATNTATTHKIGDGSTYLPNIQKYGVIAANLNNSYEITAGTTLTYLPSDNYTGATSYCDPKAKYRGTNPYLAPSPYLNDAANAEYYRLSVPNTSSYNCLADFNGKDNTAKFVSFSSGSKAAIVAQKYAVSGAEEIAWYLPSAGEFGYLVARLKTIIASLSKVGGSALVMDYNTFYWTSTISSAVYQISLYNGEIWTNATSNSRYVRPFAMLDF